MDRSTRRQFLQMAAAAGIGSSGVFETILGARPEPAYSPREPGDGAVILFQGDSITDAGRDRESKDPNGRAALGPGYAFLAASELLASHPDKELQCYNRGISGNKVFQLADRWQEDCLDLEPDVLSILIGVNDFWHTRNGGYDGTVEIYEHDYRQLLDTTRKALPDVRLILGEPYALPGGSAVSADWFPAFDRYRRAAREIAEDYNAAFIPYQSIFEEASDSVPQTYWAPDGVHPSAAGCGLMAEAWLKALRSMDS